MAEDRFQARRSALFAYQRGPAAARRTCISAVGALLLLGLAGCTQMPHREGPRAQLIDGIAEPRSREEIDITVYEVPITAWGKCLELVGRVEPVKAALSVLMLAPYHACAIIPRDADLKPGQRPWCLVAVPEGDPETLEHELRHCEGWAHPRTTTANRPSASSTPRDG